MSEIRMVAGLGNPGPEYSGTRHNIGFEVIDALADSLGTEVRQKKFSALFGQTLFGDIKLLLLKPGLYMNRSGQVLATAAGFFKLEPAQVLVVMDDMALEPGRLRIRAQGSAGGHNGLADIIQKLGTDRVPRLRVGIGKSPYPDSKDYVLGRFDAEQRRVMDETVPRAVEAVRCWLQKGTQAAMNRYNADETDNG